MIEWVQENLGVVVPVGIVALMSLFEVSKIEINPWSFILEFIGDRINRKTIDSLDSLSKQIESLRIKLDKETYERVESDVYLLRSTIIEASLSLRKGDHFTRSKYDEVLRAKSRYDELVKKYNLKNNILERDFDYIYDRMLEDEKEGDFF